jgi:hypothetical protein
MSHSSSPPVTSRTRSGVTLDHAWAVIADVLSGDARREIVGAAYRDRDLGSAFARLRTGMRSHAFRTARGNVDLGGIVAELDARTRREGFHVFLEWHEVAYRFIEEDIPVVLLDYATGLDLQGRGERALAVLLDYYFLYVLALCATRAWDEGDPGASLDRVTALLAQLQGPAGSGRRFVDDAATLLWIAVSTYEPDELAYRRLLERVRALPDVQRRRVARVGAPLLGCHLRWGFPHLYERDLGRMRADNFIDYPWLFFSVASLADEYAALAAKNGPEGERLDVAAALLNGLSPDPEAFIGEPPAALAPWQGEHARVRALIARHRDQLVRDFRRHTPTGGYSPLGFHFNFPHNAVFAMAVLGLLDGDTPRVSLDALLTGRDAGVGELAESLTRFAEANPEPRGSRLVAGLYYDEEAAGRAFAEVTGALETLRPQRP